tara:strand:- start:177 stop:578 length:402 start_codon:yes stop_codon:yes gene_type:complete
MYNMSESSGSILQQFNINELAGATGLILGALGGILAIIFKSRCYCRLNLCYLCFCERKPPPDKEADSDDDEEKKKLKKKPVVEPQTNLDKQVDKPVDKIVKPVDRTSFEKPREPEPEPEMLIPTPRKLIPELD